MAITYSDYTGDGTNKDFAFSFPYLEDTHVVVEVDGVDKTTTAGDFTLPTTSLARMTVAPADGALVRVKRVSDFATDLVDFTNGSVLTEGDLDRAYQHNRYLNEEAAEGNDASMQIVGGGTDYNAANKKIVNLATPTASLDAANKNYVDDHIALSSSNLNAFEKSTHTGDNTETEFTLSFTSQTNTDEAYLVTIDGVVQTPTTAYGVNSTTNKITFTSAPPTSANIVVVPLGTSPSANDAVITATGTTVSRSLATRAADVLQVDDFASVQAGLDYLVANGGILEFTQLKTYTITTPLTAQLDSTVKERRWEIRGNGATLDCSSMTGTDVGLTIGGTGLANLNEKGYYAISGLRILGPEAAVPVNEGSATTTMVGLFIHYAIRVNLTNVECTRCYTGIKTAYVFPLTATNCNVENNFIGLHLDDVSNVHKWNQLSAKQCWYSVLIFKSGTYSPAKIAGLNFEGLWTEGSKVGVHVDPGTSSANRIVSLRFANGFYKTIEYDAFRFGTLWTFATPQTRTDQAAPNVGKILDVEIEGGNFPGAPADADTGTFVFNDPARVYGFFGHASVDVSDTNAWVNEPSMGEFLSTGDEAVGTATDFKKRYWNYSDRSEPVLVPESTSGAYVTGDWTPVISFSPHPTNGSVGDLSVTYTHNYGTYTKIGRLVTLHFDIETATFTHTTYSWTASLRVGDLPYAPRAISGQTYRPRGMRLPCSGITGEDHISCIGSAGDSVLTFLTDATNPVDDSIVPSGGTVRLLGTIQYETDA